MTVGYQTDKTGLSRTRQVGDVALTLRAEKVRQERTGVHALLEIVANGVRLAWTNGNLERDEDRVRLGNSAFKHLKGRISANGHAVEYTAENLKKDLDDFARGLWDAHTATQEAEAMPGYPERLAPALVLDPYLVEGGGTIFFAPPKRGKSFLLLLMAVSIDSGCDLLWSVRQTPVLFVNLERSRGSLQNRLGAVNRALGLDPERPLPMLNARGRSLLDIYGAAERSVEHFKAGLVLLDSISRAGAGDLNDNAPANRIVDLLNGLAPTWGGIGHTSRATDSHVYGSQHFDAGADVLVQVLSEQAADGELGVGLNLTGENDLGPQPLQVVALGFDRFGLNSARRAARGEFTEIEQSAKPPTPADLIVKHLLKVGKATVASLAHATGLATGVVQAVVTSDRRIITIANTKGGMLYGVGGEP